jgi:hypothetical protein
MGEADKNGSQMFSIAFKEKDAVTATGIQTNESRRLLQRQKKTMAMMKNAADDFQDSDIPF